MTLKYRPEARDIILNRLKLVVTEDNERFITSNLKDPGEFIYLPPSADVMTKDQGMQMALPIENWMENTASMRNCLIWNTDEFTFNRSSLVWIGNNNRGMWAYYN